MLNENDLRARVARAGQDHLFTFWPQLDRDQQQALLADLAQVDFDLLDTLTGAGAPASPIKPAELTPPTCLPAEPASPEDQRQYAQARQEGLSLIARGKVAAMVVAGGQGTRLGFDGPKGAFPASPVENKPLFRLFAEGLLATGLRSGQPVRWYVMTSPANDAQTRAFFDEHGHFGLDPGQVFFFKQGVMPAVDRQGRILLADRHRLALSPDGHGGSIRALARSGALADLANHGIEVLSYFQVDNPLVRPVDPLLIGLHDQTGSQLSSLTIGKARDDEPVGVFALADGKLGVVEYSDLPAKLARARNPDGSRTFDAANIAVHVLSRRFLDDLTAPGSGLAQPWHRAEKIVPFVDTSTGRRVVPDAPNAIKFEMFIFDALPLARNPLLLESRRGQVFSPIKNATGTDSPDTSRRDQSSRAVGWLEQCGMKVPRNPDGQPDCTVEISPLLAQDAAELAERLDVPPSIAAGQCFYLAE
ncbi:MAG: UTP--glucose-1-phosphate uridylyltransferase [Phycisphaerae bacterium]